MKIKNPFSNPLDWQLPSLRSVLKAGAKPLRSTLQFGSDCLVGRKIVKTRRKLADQLEDQHLSTEERMDALNQDK